MPSHSGAERLALASALTAAGPDAPTLCEGWTTNDLAAHLVMRERRPDAALGMILSSAGPLSRWTDRVQGRFAGRRYDDLVSAVRSGPSRLSWAALPGVDTQVNLLEHFMHCQDVLRAGPHWEPRDLPADRQQAIWSMLLRVGRMLLRGSPVPVTLQTPEGVSRRIVAGNRTSKSLSNAAGTVPGVLLTGDPGELALYVYGRGDHAEVTLDGPPEAVTRFRELDLQF